MGIAQPVETRGQRLAKARRLLSVVLGRDLGQAEVAALAGVGGNAWNEWERGISYPRARNLEKVLALFVRHGMPYITDKWFDYGVEENDFPQIVTGAVDVRPTDDDEGPEDGGATGPVPKQPPVPTHRVGRAKKSVDPAAKKSGGRGR